MVHPHNWEGELANASFLENIYEEYLKNSQAIDPRWGSYFQSLDTVKPPAASFSEDDAVEEVRRNGHLAARINPITKDTLAVPHPKVSTRLQNIYSGRIGFEYQHIQDQKLKEWLKDKIENHFFNQELNPSQQQRILEYLNQSELFETFLHTKYVGQKRFSLEGVETLIPMLALIIETGAMHGVLEFVIGMAHRGRLNVLSNLLNKSYDAIFLEFEEASIPESFEGMGDVKYHKGYVGEDVKFQGKKIKVTLCPNPSHLESVNCVVEGGVRAKQFGHQDLKRSKVIPLLIHGDAAIAGQGVVYETFQIAKLEGYTTGGTLHFVINNQIGFTTLPRDLRSTVYCTDIAKSFDCPIFHVNAEDPEGCVHAALLAYEIRQLF
ncbi:MAG: 2-oxoglutarate dehydrogenase subunit E1, partial [Parachlamydia sp.]|nr:2-oxoglutarate dehydrogenase subunit E1 [Parachlamydia sp.]